MKISKVHYEGVVVVVEIEEKEIVIKAIDENVNQIHELIQQKIQIWLDYVLFSGLWWLGIGLSIVPWIIWFIVRDKKSSDRLLYAGVTVMVISVMLDVLGDQLGFWHYRFSVIPILPTYVPWDICLMPVAIIILLQIKPRFSPVIKAISFALITSYLAEPFFEWIQIYQTLKWKYSYSVPIQIGIYLFAHYISRRKQFPKLSNS
ncbi:CBO0543 family protein [Alkalihalobacterium alkalinitrilicum]|uniref:CBO0543 family protein n=1 Tax=Alkalihalobacterium alkalinitrilicum TaxID=427920 RepID=UPI001EE3BC11|nr:CBO0543 family protein [Alkalihalobacterium alkalinitrilicum]